MSEKGKIKIARRNITGPPPANAIAIKMHVTVFLDALNVRREGDMVTIYLDPKLAQVVTAPGVDPIRLSLLVEYSEQPAPPPPAKAESCPKPSETQSKETCKKPDPPPVATKGETLW